MRDAVIVSTARTPLTKAKGFYWAGRAAQRAGMQDEANRLYEAAAQWPDYYYAQLALKALGRSKEAAGAASA